MIPRSQAFPGEASVEALPAPRERAEAASIPADSTASETPFEFLSPPITRPPVAMLGVPFDHVTAADCLSWIDSAIASRRPHYVVTPNVDFLVQARFDVELRRILLDAHLVLCDGTPLVWASRLLGNALPERVAGADVVPALIRSAADQGYRLFFLGASPEVCAQAVEALKRAYPNLIITGHYSPPFSKLLEMDHDEIARRIREAKPDVLFVCFGCPKQEKWIAMHYRNLDVPVSIGLGATIDFLAGQVKRAPVWMRRTGLEWTYRLAQEPRRLFKRYVKDLWVFGWTMTAHWWRLQFRSSPRPGPSEFCSSQSGASWQRFKLPASLDAPTIGANRKKLDLILNDPRHCFLDASEVSFIDSTGIGSLVRLHQKLLYVGRQLILLAPSLPVRRALQLARLHEFVACARDVPAALQIIESRSREQAAAVNRRTAAAINPLAWHGEITAANAESVWKFTRQHINSLCITWKTTEGDTQFRDRSAPEQNSMLEDLKLRILNPPTLPQQREVIIDLSNVRFIDSTGLGLMVRAKKLATGQGAHLAFTSLQPAVRNVLRIARLEEFLLA